MAIYLLLILLLFSCQHMNILAENSALCFIMKYPTYQNFSFVQELTEDAKKYHLDIFMMIDDNRLNLSKISTKYDFRLLRIENNQSRYYGYQKSIELGDNEREITSWDKALLYFTVLNKNYSFVWLIENDVFIPSVQAFRSLHQLYFNTSDLIVPNSTVNLIGKTSTWHWSMAADKLILPWASSMVNVVGLSQRMLVAIADYVRWLGEVPYHEFFFHSLAIHLNFTMVVPTELSAFFYRRHYSDEEVLRQPNNLWHSFKDRVRQSTMRKRLGDYISQNNYTIDLTDLDMLCHKNENMTKIEQYLKNFQSQFEIQKSKFSTNDRVLLRQRFINLTEQCQKQNVSKQIILLIMTLADHAYKLPEPSVKSLINNKSELHLRLERLLAENKATIMQLPLNSSRLVELRQQGKNITKQLTNEMKREIQMEKGFEKQTNLSSSSIASSSPQTGNTTTSTMISRLLITNEATIIKKPKISYILTHSDDYEISNSYKDYSKILFFILSGFCVLFILLQWQVVQDRKNYLVIIVTLSLLACWYFV
ncbi:unnamed protein product [Adineta steineri]|uniref:Uncharacterized protein n=1 Tax=Adineta steineri TaxID=433720 RepID=A0A815JPR4_9BILA|nr:unnamed protein product [Adineta steineri]CAF1379481.1 unnamed protein product [Adineta steineri]